MPVAPYMVASMFQSYESMLQEPLALLETDFAAALALMTAEAPSCDPATWLHAPPPMAALALETDALLALDATLGSIGLGILRAKTDFARRFSQWLGLRIGLIGSWDPAAQSPPSEALVALSSFKQCHEGLNGWHEAHASQLLDVGRTQDLFQHEIDFDLVLLPLLRWGTDALSAAESTLTVWVQQMADAVLHLCPSEATLRSPALLVDADLQKTVRDTFKAADISSAVAKLAECQGTLSMHGLLDRSRSERIKPIMRLGKLTVGTDFALAKLALCRAAPDTSAAAAIACSAREKIAQKKTPLPPAIKAALDKIANTV